MKRSSKKGFTLAELLIVIAIIAILISILFPVFGAQLDKARAAAELANVRAKYSELVADAMLGGTKTTNLTEAIAGVDDIQIDSGELAKAMKYDTTKVKFAKGTVTVTYNKYSGSFDVDEDVSFTKNGTFYNNGTTTAPTK